MHRKVCGWYFKEHVYCNALMLMIVHTFDINKYILNMGKGMHVYPKAELSLYFCVFYLAVEEEQYIHRIS